MAESHRAVSEEGAVGLALKIPRLLFQTWPVRIEAPQVRVMAIFPLQGRELGVDVFLTVSLARLGQLLSSFFNQAGDC